MKIAIMLGAGASASEGAPLQKDLFKEFFRSSENVSAAGNRMFSDLANFFQLIFGIDVGEPKEIPLHFQSNGHPLNLTWTMKNDRGVRYSLLDKKGTAVVAKLKMTEGGSISLSVDDEHSYFLRVERIPQQFSLLQNYPNPFNPTTTIRFDLPTAASVTLTIYNLLGQRVLSASENQLLEEGQQSVQVDARNLSSGAYFYRLEASGNSNGGKTFSEVRKMMVLR
jgi:hypothetical protein